jgi:DNA repair protein RecO (recombination protein O)
MRLETEAVIVAVRPHGEHGAIVRALTPTAGIQPGYVRGGKSRRLRPVLVPGNRIAAEYRARTEDQLPHLTAELAHSRAFLLSEPLAAAGIEWATALSAAALPEGQPYPNLYQGLEGLLSAIEAAPSARGWAAALVRYEALVLREVGFGIDASGLLPAGPVPDWPAIDTALQRTGRYLARDLLIDRQAEVLVARERLLQRLKRMAG